MGETLILLFRKRENATFELQVKESWSGRTVTGDFIPPYTTKQVNLLLKKLNSLDSNDQELREVGQRLFAALCGEGNPDATVCEVSVRSVLRGVIQRTLKRRGTVALTFSFGPGCDEFVRYPWELLHNGDYFLLVSGIFTLSRALLRPDLPGGCELPVHPPMRVLYIGASPIDCAPLETERSYEALEQALAPLIDAGHVFLDRLEPPTFDQLVRYFNSYGGAGVFDDTDTTIPCYVVHFDGHGAYGRLCPNEDCETVNEADARKCVKCATALTRVTPQTYLCFCDDQGRNRFIDTQSLRELFLSSDLRLAVFSACETAALIEDTSRSHRRRSAVDATLATALVTAQVPAVVAMPFSLQDDLSPTFIFHFYEALADGRTLEEALSRARQALLPMQQKSWFVPVLYRHVSEGSENPVPLLASEETFEENEHPLSYLGVPTSFIGRTQELQDLNELLAVAINNDPSMSNQGHLKLRPGTHHIAITGSPGIGKSALTFEAVRRNRDKFLGGIFGVSLDGGKSFSDALAEIIHRLHIPLKVMPSDVHARARLVLGSLRSLASRELPCLLLLDSFEEVKDSAELEMWLHFLCSVPQEVIVLMTSHSNPETMMVLEGPHCRWYEYHLGKMADVDLLHLFTDLASSSGLDQQIHLDRPEQQAILREICTLLDGYPLGAELIFGTARSIDGKVYMPEAATRSLEEIRDELRSTPLAGILAVLEISYQRLTPLARQLLAYLATFKLPFSREQIMMLIAPEALEEASAVLQFERGHKLNLLRPHEQEKISIALETVHDAVPSDLVKNWRAARDELVQASFIQFDGHIYTIHPQIRHFALAHLPVAERRRVHRVIAAYYYNQPQPSPDEWFVAFEHLENAGEAQDLQEAIHVAIRASWALGGRGYTPELQFMLKRAGWLASRLGDATSEGRIECCLGAILRLQGQYTEAEACFRSSLTFHQQQKEPEDQAWAYYELAMLAREAGNFEDAQAYVQEALTLFTQAGNKSGECWTSLVSGEVQRGTGHYQAALQCFEHTLSGFRLQGNKEGMAWALHDRGNVYQLLGQHTKALSDYEDAQRLFTTLELRLGLAWVFIGKSAVYVLLNKLELAESLCTQAMALFREQGIRRGEAWTLYTMGDMMLAQTDLVRSREYYERASLLFNEVGDSVDQARVLVSSGTLALRENSHFDAQELYEQALSIAQSQKARSIEGQALLGLGNVEQTLGHLAEADHYYRQALHIATELFASLDQYMVLQQLGSLCIVRKQYAEALDCLIQAMLIGQRLNDATHQDLRARVDVLVAEQHLETGYQELCARYGFV